MPHLLNWIFMACFVTAVIGFGLYMYEVLQGDIGRYTRWNELNKRGTLAAGMILLGALGLVTLIVGVTISRNF